MDINSIGSPGTAKNVLTVGATENDRLNRITIWGIGGAATTRCSNQQRSDLGRHAGMAAFSSRGPTDDGRIKPDVVAPGTYRPFNSLACGGSTP